MLSLIHTYLNSIVKSFAKLLCEDAANNQEYIFTSCLLEELLK